MHPLRARGRQRQHPWPYRPAGRLPQGVLRGVQLPCADEGFAPAGAIRRAPRTVPAPRPGSGRGPPRQWRPGHASPAPGRSSAPARRPARRHRSRPPRGPAPPPAERPGAAHRPNRDRESPRAAARRPWRGRGRRRRAGTRRAPRGVCRGPTASPPPVCTPRSATAGRRPPPGAPGRRRTPTVCSAPCTRRLSDSSVRMPGRPRGSPAGLGGYLPIASLPHPSRGYRGAPRPCPALNRPADRRGNTNVSAD